MKSNNTCKADQIISFYLICDWFFREYVMLTPTSDQIKAGDELWVTDVLIQKEKVDIDGEKGTQISIVAKKILTQG